MCFIPCDIDGPNRMILFQQICFFNFSEGRVKMVNNLLAFASNNSGYEVPVLRTRDSAGNIPSSLPCPRELLRVPSVR